MHKVILLFLIISTSIIACQSNSNDKQSIVYENISMQSFVDTTLTDAILLDVRTPSEYADGNISGSINIDYKSANFSEQLEHLDVDKKYVVYCRSGRRSVAACELMSSKGFKSLINVEGGYLEYQKINNK